MTAFDIYSAIGGVNEDILEESEIMPKKKITKIIPLMAAAACFAVVAVGLSHTFRSDDIEQPVTDMTIGSTVAEINIQTSPYETGEESSPTTGDGFTVSENTDPNAPTETVEVHTETSPAVVEEETESQATLHHEDAVEIHTDTYTSVTEETTVCPTDTPILPVDEEEGVIIPKWEDLSDLERYIYLDYAGNEYSITMGKFDKSELTFLRNSEIFGIDEYTDKKYSVECAVYKIDNIDPEYMVAVPTADGLYTGFKRERFWYDTLGEAVEGTGILTRNIIGDTVSISDDDARQTTVYTVPSLQQAAEKLLTSAPDTAVHVNPPNDSGFVSYKVYGKDGKWILNVYATGYVYFGVSYFNPGVEYAEEFIDYVKQNSTNIEVIPYDEPNADEPVITE